MDAKENYEFRKDASRIFNRNITEIWKDSEGKQYLKQLSPEEAQKIVNTIWGKSKIEAVFNVNKKADAAAMQNYKSVNDYNDRFDYLKKEDSDAYEILKEKVKLLP
jgi:hypothetical protein